MTTTMTTTTTTTIDWAALARDAAAQAAARAVRATKARQPRPPGLASRFLAEFRATAPEGTPIPLTAAIAVWIASQRQEGVDLGVGKTPEASISARVYTDAKAGALPAGIRLGKEGNTAMLTLTRPG